MTTSPRLGFTELTAGQAVPETSVNEEHRYLEQGATHFQFKDRNLATPPGSPADGDCYLVATSGTGAWSGKDGKIAFYMSTAWVFITAKEGFRAYVNDEDIEIVYNGSTWGQPPASTSGLIRPIAFFFTTTPTASEVLLLYTACEAITLADEFAGSVGDVGTNPTSSFVMDVQKNGSSAGSITISTGGAFTFATTGTTVSLASGDQLKVVGPGSADATCANVSVTFKGTL